jgi:4,5-dihydroxyphthalate decarboxylase
VAEPKLTFATQRRWDRTYLMDGVVRVQDFDITYLDYSGPGGMTLFFRDMVTKLSYDIGEQAFSHYLIAKDQGKPLTAIPAFPSRFFPHLGVSVRNAAGIDAPRDLVGKRVLSQDWGHNPAVWMRGVLAHQYEVPIERILWVEDGSYQGFRGLPYPHSRRFQMEQVQVGEGISPRDLLEDGVVDAALLASGGIPPTGSTRKLFPDPYREIAQYVAETGVFPINHVVTLKDEVVQAHPELPTRLMEGFQEALRLYNRDVQAGKEAAYTDVDVKFLLETGLFPAEYGLPPNRQAVRMGIHYCYEQGLIRKLYEPEELFDPSVI